jgi:insulin-like growth factor 2 mRNA-binding protein 1
MENNTEDGNTNAANRSTKVFLRQLPSDVDWSDVEKLAADFGEVVSVSQGGTSESPSAIVAYKTSDEAAEASEKLDKKEIGGTAIKASLYFERGRNVRRNGGGAQRGVGGYQNVVGAGGDFRQSNVAASAGLPLRMIVGARYVGAIIGQGGANIREITRDSKARCVVDVNRGLRDQGGNVEKVINIYGTPESCTKAAVKILEVVLREAAKDPANQGKPIEPELKIRAHNNLVGRLIGKSGSTIKKIMEETGCTIFVSNISELTAFNMERTITVRGTLENISQAESKISGKLRQCWENDAANAPGAMYPGMYPLMQVPGMGAPIDPYCYSLAGGVPSPYAQQVPQIASMGRHAGVPMHAAAAAIPPQAGAAYATAGMTNAAPICYTEIVHIWVPNNVVGALIGTKGTHIRNIMRTTGAHIRIESTKNEAAEGGEQQQEKQEKQEKQGEPVQEQRNQGAGDQHAETDRRVTITGTDQQQYKAQCWVFQRLCEQTHQFFDEIRLCTEVQVPSKLVGRIIGKGGQNVRELQRLTGAQVKIPEDAATHEENEDTFVRIIGTFNASQAVQVRIRQLVQQFHAQHGQLQRSVSGDRQRASNSRGVNHSESHE